MEPNFYSSDDPNAVDKLLKMVMAQSPIWMSHIRKFAGKQIPLADYDDILSNFYEKVFKHGLKILDTPTAVIHPFLLRILQSKVIDYLRKKKRMNTFKKEYTDFLISSNNGLIEHHSELIQEVLHLLQKTLSPDRLAVMNLVFKDDHKDLEIGKILGLPKNTISTLKRRSRLKLQSYRQHILSLFL